MKKLSWYILKLFGWKIDPHTPEGVKKCVIAVGPHTSNWDFIIGWLAFQYYGINASYLIKSDLFYPPLGWLLKAMGGIPVDRKKKNNMTEYAASLFEKNEELYLVFTPEGTRKYNPNWKRGFYYIALQAKVPIYICYMDYEKKIGGFHSLLIPTGDVEADIDHVKKVMSQFKGRFPEKGVIYPS
jgi:1-acyl-sn-glycerol-3-phosphate acyltransferase